MERDKDRNREMEKERQTDEQAVRDKDDTTTANLVPHLQHALLCSGEGWPL